MEIDERIQLKNDVIAVVGLEYVGLPFAAAFAAKVKTLGFDINQEKINIYQEGIAPTNIKVAEAAKLAENAQRDVNIDIKHLYEQKSLEEDGYSYWSL